MPKPPPPKPTPRTRPDLDLDSLGRTTPRHPSKALDLSELSKSSSRDQSLDLSALSASTSRSKSASRDALDLSSLAAGGRRSAAARGPSRAETDRTAHQAVGAATGLDANSLSALKAKITRLWRPPCGVPGADSITVKVRIALTASHELAGAPTLISRGSSGVDSDVVAAAATRALAAVRQGAPYTELPPDAPRDIVLNFLAKDACGG